MMIILKKMKQLEDFNQFGLIQICSYNRDFINGYNILRRNEIEDVLFNCLFNKNKIFIPDYIYKNEKFLKHVKKK